jgi:5-formyltetrahydrofolate cyclo-ligase
LPNGVSVQVRSAESLRRRTGHHLNFTVQGKFDSGISGVSFLCHFCSPHLPGRETSLSISIAEIQQQKKFLRRELRARRNGLAAAEQEQASRRLFATLASHDLFRSSQRITFTLARDGEIDTMPLMLEAHRLGKQCYLPVMVQEEGIDRLQFRQWEPAIALNANFYGIPEPQSEACPPEELDLVLLPLVGFDAKCNRLGMGKGYYDHSFAFIRDGKHAKPVLLGLAHECQRVERLEVASWDVPLQGIVTDKAWYRP